MVGTIIASIIIFGLLIFVHELGHYLVAKWAKIRVLEFAIGYGKELFSWEKGETRYTLRLFPLGGFCRLLGEEPEDLPQEGNFQEKSLAERFCVIAAGSVMNFLLAIVLFADLFVARSSVTDSPNWQSYTRKPCLEAGLKKAILSWLLMELRWMTEQHCFSNQFQPGKRSPFRYKRTGKYFISVIPEREAMGGGLSVLPGLQKV